MQATTATATKDGLRVVAYPGGTKILLAMSLDDGKVEDLAGFTIWRKAAGKETALSNRLSFTVGVTNETTAGTHRWTPSDQAPFQKFRWVDVPPDGFNAPLTYRVRAQYFTGQGSAMQTGPEVSVTIAPVQRRHAKFQPGFTRSYITSQAYADKFQNKDIRPSGAYTPTFDTKPFQAQYQWLGADARRKLFDFIADCENDQTAQVSVFAYDLDEPDIIAAICRIGKQGRLKAILDNAPLHTMATALEVAAAKLIIAAAGAANVRKGHFQRFQHNKVFIKRDRSGKAQKVLFGSMNFSVRGIYVQANNLIVVDDPTTAGMFAQAFDEAFRDGVEATPFRASQIARGYMVGSATDTADLPKFSLALSPHTDSSISLNPVSQRIRAATSSVLFAVMEPKGSGSVLDTLRQIAAKPTVFSYGTVETNEGLAVQSPNGAMGQMTSFAALTENVPPPFNKEFGGMGIHSHNKFVVVDFNAANPTVFTGSSNLAAGGEQDNGDSLAMIEDASIATMYAIEAVAMFDHYHFNKAANAATQDRPLTLWSPGKSETPWWQQYYDKTQIQMRDRCLFANVPLPAGMDIAKTVDWSALGAAPPPSRGRKKAAAKRAAGRKKAAAKKAPAKRKALPKRKAAPKKGARKKAARRTIGAPRRKRRAIDLWRETVRIPEPSPRYANAAVLPLSGNQPLSQDHSFSPGEIVRLRLDIGPLSAESQVEAAQALPKILQGKAELDVMVSSTDFVIGETAAVHSRGMSGQVRHGHFSLPVDGGPGRTKKGGRYLTFYLRAPARVGTAYCRIGYYFRNALVQSQQLRSAVGQPGGFAIHTDFTLSETLTDLDVIPRRQRLSVLTNENAGGLHQIVVRHLGVPPRDRGADSVKGRTFVLRTDNIGTTLHELRKQLWMRKPDEKHRSPRDLIEDLRTFAPLGFKLYAQLGDAVGDALFDARADSKPVVIQVQRPDTSSFVLPWALCYDIPLDSQRRSELCPLLDQWKGDVPLLTGMPRVCPHEHPRANVLCPFGFIGFRYGIEQLSSTDRPVLTIPTKPRCDFAIAQTQVGIRNPPALRRHIDMLRKLGADLTPPAQFAEASARDAVQTMLGRDLSLIYFFCHGDRPKAGDPDTILKVGNDEPITARDLIGWLDTWRDKLKRRIWSDVRPLIFINACHSVAIEPGTLVTYLDAFISRGHAAGVIGTEVAVAQPLAMDFAEQFFRKLLDEKLSVEDALHAIRIDYLANGNLFGLIYTPYCWADLKVG